MKPVPDIPLTPYERRRLNEIRNNNPTVQVYKRATVILLSNQGQTAEKIAQLTGYSIQSVWGIRRRWRQLRFSGLANLPRPGRPPVITDEYLEKLKETLSKSPTELGYVFVTWSCQRLVEHLKKETGIAVHPEHLRRVMHQIGYTYQRPKYTLKNVCNKGAYRRAKRALGLLKKGLSRKMLLMNYGLGMG